jgi:hypothetical protein
MIDLKRFDLKTYTPDRFCTKDEKGNIEESYASYA